MRFWLFLTGSPSCREILSTGGRYESQQAEGSQGQLHDRERRAVISIPGTAIPLSQPLLRWPICCPALGLMCSGFCLTFSYMLQQRLQIVSLLGCCLTHLSNPNNGPVPSAASFYIPSIPYIHQDEHHPLTMFGGHIHADPNITAVSSNAITANLYFFMVKNRKTADKDRIIFWFNVCLRHLLIPFSLLNK